MSSLTQRRSPHREPLLALAVLASFLIFPPLLPCLAAPSSSGFRAPHVIPENASTFVLGQFDSLVDGHLDVFVVAPISKLYRGCGDGRHVQAAAFEKSFDSPGVSVAAGFFNDDPFLDVAIAQPSPKTLHVLLGDGRGGFPTIRLYDLAFGGPGDPTSDVLAADFNNDGIDDLVVSSADREDFPIPDCLEMFLGNPDGVFSAPQQIDTTSNVPYDLEALDADEDGDVDIATVPCGSTMRVLVNDGTGLAFTGTLFVVFQGVGSTLVAGDIDLDGFEDIVTEDGSVLWGKAGVDFDITPKILCLRRPALSDFNGDGYLDIVDSRRRVLLSSGATRTFSQSQRDMPPRSSAPLFNSTDEIQIGDFDADGNPDVAFTLPDLDVIGVDLGSGNGQTSPNPLTHCSVGGRIVGCAVNDFNGDGSSDVAVISESLQPRIGLALGDGTGTLHPAICTALTFGLIREPQAVASGCFNNDEHPDVVVANTDQVGVLLGDGQGSFTEQNPFRNGDLDGLAAGDFDEDGIWDVVTVHELTHELVVRLGVGDGTLSGAQRFMTRVRPLCVTVIDLDQDGHLDLVAASHPGIAVHLGDGTGDYSLFYTVESMGTGRPIGLAVGHFDRDARLDLAVLHAEEFSILHAQGDGTFQQGTIFPVDFGTVAVRAADFDRDGNVDLVLLNPSIDAVTVLHGDGGGNFDSTPAHLLSSTQNPVVADLNDDALPELLIPCTSGILSILLNESFDPSVCVQGTVNAEAGAASDVLFLNGSAGTGPNRLVCVPTGQQIDIDLATAPAGPLMDAKYILYVWADSNMAPVQLTSGATTLGCLVNPSPLQRTSGPQPAFCLRAQGIPSVACRGVMQLNAPTSAPFTVSNPNGVANPVTFLLQGILEDHSRATPPKFSTTNALTLSIE